MKVNLYYDYHTEPGLGSGNLGDVVTKEIFLKIFNIETCRSNIRDCRCASTGSVLDYFLKEKSKSEVVDIWGSGFIEESFGGENPKFYNNLNLFALRGKYTKERIERCYGRKLEGIALGDPGLLSNLLLDVRSKKKYKLGIIPHYIDFGNSIFESISKNYEGSKIINIMGDPIETIKEIDECEYVISTALHGLIISDSLSIPNLWCELSDKVYGKGFKFKDYYSAIEVPSPKPFDLRAFEDSEGDLISIISDNYKVQSKEVDRARSRLKKSFPYKNFLPSDRVKRCPKRKKSFFSKLKNSIKKRIKDFDE